MVVGDDHLAATGMLRSARGPIRWRQWSRARRVVGPRQLDGVGRVLRLLEGWRVREVALPFARESVTQQLSGDRGAPAGGDLGGDRLVEVAGVAAASARHRGIDADRPDLQFPGRTVRVD